MLSDLAWGLWEILLDHVNRYELEGRHEADRDSYEWQDHRWLVRPDDWNSGTIPPTVLYSPEDLSRKLDDHDDGTPFVVQVDTEEQAVDCLNMLAGALDGQATVVLTDVSAKDELKSWATSAQRTRVFGKLGAQISGRMGWLFGFGESPPAMRSKVTTTPFRPVAGARDSYTLRMSFQWLYGEQVLDRVKRHPGDCGFAAGCGRRFLSVSSTSATPGSGRKRGAVSLKDT